jgi:hypothetical protein
LSLVNRKNASRHIGRFTRDGKLTGKNKVEVSILGKAAESEHTKNSTDSRKEMMIQSMRDAADILAAVPDLGFRAEDARAIGLSLFIART